MDNPVLTGWARPSGDKDDDQYKHPPPCFKRRQKDIESSEDSITDEETDDDDLSIVEEDLPVRRSVKRRRELESKLPAKNAKVADADTDWSSSLQAMHFVIKTCQDQTSKSAGGDSTLEASFRAALAATDTRCAALTRGREDHKELIARYEDVVQNLKSALRNARQDTRLLKRRSGIIELIEKHSMWLMERKLIREERDLMRQTVKAEAGRQRAEVQQAKNMTEVLQMLLEGKREEVLMLKLRIEALEEHRGVRCAGSILGQGVSNDRDLERGEDSEID